MCHSNRLETRLLSHSPRHTLCLVSFVSSCLYSSRLMFEHKFCLVSFVSFSSYLSLKVLSQFTLVSFLEHVSIDMFHASFRLRSGFFMFLYVSFAFRKDLVVNRYYVRYHFRAIVVTTTSPWSNGKKFVGCKNAIGYCYIEECYSQRVVILGGREGFCREAH